MSRSVQTKAPERNDESSFMQYNSTAPELSLFRRMALAPDEAEQITSFPTDAEMITLIQNWLTDITLGSHSYNIPIPDHDIFQIHSRTYNLTKYGVLIRDAALLKEITINAEMKHDSLDADVLSNSEYAFGYLVLAKRVEHRPHPTKKAGMEAYDPTRIIIRDTYYLHVFNENAQPIATVWAHEISPMYFIDHPITLEDTPYFPESDTLILDWHEISEIVGYNQTQLYVNACFANTDFPLPIWGNNSTTPNEYTLIYAPFDSVNLFIGEDLEQYDTLYVPDRPNRYSGFPTFRSRLTRIPKPQFDNENELHIRFINALQQRLNDSAEYLEDGLFVIKFSELTQLAAHDGEWGSGPELAASLTIAGELITGAASGIGAAVVAAGTAIHARMKYQEGKKELARLGSSCDDTAGDDCRKCYSKALSDFKSAQDTAFTSAVAGLAGSIISAILSSSNPLLLLVFLANLLTGIAGAATYAESKDEYDKIMEKCNRSPSKPNEDSTMIAARSIHGECSTSEETFSIHAEFAQMIFPIGYQSRQQTFVFFYPHLMHAIQAHRSISHPTPYPFITRPRLFYDNVPQHSTNSHEINYNDREPALLM